MTMQATNFIDLLDAFHDHLDNIYFEGYALELMESNPTSYDFHLEQYRENFI